MATAIGAFYDCVRAQSQIRSVVSKDDVRLPLASIVKWKMLLTRKLLIDP